MTNDSCGTALAANRGWFIMPPARPCAVGAEILRLRGIRVMLQRLNHRAAHHALLLAVGACLFLVNLGGASLWDVDEGRNATCSTEMLESHNYIIPYFNGVLRSHKP